MRGGTNVAWLAVWDGCATLTCYFAARHRESLAQLPVPEDLRVQAARAEMSGRLLPLVVEVRSVADAEAAAEVVRCGSSSAADEVDQRRGRRRPARVRRSSHLLRSGLSRPIGAPWSRRGRTWPEARGGAMEGNATWRRALRPFAWVSGEPDPRALQLGFVLLVGLDRLLRRVGGVPLGDGNWPLRGAVLALLLLVVLAATPRVWARRRRLVVAVLAVADLGVIGISLFGPEGGGVGLLVVLPALWLGNLFRLRGAIGAALATLLMVTLPALLAPATAGEGLSRLLPLPIIAGLGAVALAAGLDLAEASQRRAEEGERRLERALRALEAERQTSQKVFDAVDVGLMLLDRDGRRVGMNRRYEECVSLSLAATSLPWPGDTFAADATTRLRPDEVPSARAARGEEFDDYRIWAGADPRTRRCLSVSARRATDGDGEPVGAALACTDITDLMRALEVKEEFVATVSHELRTPLTSIAGYVSILLEDDELEPAVERKLRIVDRNTKRLTALVEALLQEAHLVDGVLPLAPCEIDLAGVVAERVRAAEPIALAGGVDLEYDGSRAAVVVADPERIGQVVDNLVSNAIKYTPRGGRVRVSVDRVADGVGLRVADTGIGIPAGELERLFTRFYRTRAATEAAIQGVGLGLSIAKAIVEGHGGRIEVTSEAGRGSEFRVWLPRSPKWRRRADPCVAQVTTLSA